MNTYQIMTSRVTSRKIIFIYIYDIIKLRSCVSKTKKRLCRDPPAAETPTACLGSVSKETMSSVALAVSIRMQKARLRLSPLMFRPLQTEKAELPVHDMRPVH